MAYKTKAHDESSELPSVCEDEYRLIYPQLPRLPRHLLAYSTQIRIAADHAFLPGLDEYKLLRLLFDPSKQRTVVRQSELD